MTTDAKTQEVVQCRGQRIVVSYSFIMYVQKRLLKPVGIVIRPDHSPSKAQRLQGIEPEANGRSQTA